MISNEEVLKLGDKPPQENLQTPARVQAVRPNRFPQSTTVMTDPLQGHHLLLNQNPIYTLLSGSESK